ncbi:hypothetical protein AB0P05_36200 [Streptomyces flaveolus]|uniref:hypothetical protein n=1 Tax=Streptomyces flaveolus TaxID=67297 RepID=UPI00342A8500
MDTRTGSAANHRCTTSSAFAGNPVCSGLGDLIRSGPTPAQACVLAVASCPGVTDVLIAASSAPHWREAADAVVQPSLTAAKLREITGVLASP